jgi:small subunit ribosomal protein S2
MVADGGTLLFVGTKKQAKDSVQSYAERCGMPYINERWLGGMLTNFETISKRVNKMKDYQRMRVSGEFEAMPKKEALLLGRELDKLERNLGGIRNMEKLPSAVFVLDTKKEHIAVTEANKLGIPVIAVVDTNCDPDIVSYVIPGNDDAIRSGELMCRIMSDAVAEGRYIRQARSGVTEAPPRTAEDEAEHARQQAEARAEAARAAAEREARIAAQAEAGSALAETGEVDEVTEAAPAGEPATEAVVAADDTTDAASAPAVETEQES